MKRHSQFWLWAGLLPVFTSHLSWFLNIQAGLEFCIPYFEGCYSVSRAIRSGPGVWLFKAAAVPAAMLMWLGWAGLRDARHSGVPLAGQGTRWMGQASAVFFLVYAMWLGTDGEIYHWLRRFGVVFYFGFAGLAHLFVASALARQGGWWRAHPPPARVYLWTVGLSWIAGVASAFKRKLIDDPAFLDRVENALEWNFALLLSASFVALAFVLRDPGRHQRESSSHSSDSGHR